MKKFNFLSNLWSLLVGSRKDDGSTRYRLVIDSLSTRYRVWQYSLGKIAVVVCMLLTIGSGNAWGADEVYKECIFHADSVTTKTSNYTSTLVCRNRTHSATWNAVNANDNNGPSVWNYIKMGQKKANKSDGDKVTTGSIITNEAYTDAVTKVVVYGTLDRGSVSVKLIYASNSAFSSNVVESSAVTSFTSGKMTFNIASPTASRYYKVEFTCTNSTTTNGVVSISKVEYYHAAASCTSISPSLSYASVGGTTLTVGSSSSGSPTITGNTGSGTVTYSSNNTSVATVNSSTGVVTAVAAGNATITASIAAKGAYCEGSATANFTITVPAYTVQFSTGTGNPTVSSRTEASGGAGITLPAGPTPAASSDGWSFAGWGYESCDNESTEPTLYIAGNKYYPSSNETLYAVYVKGKTASTNYRLIDEAAEIVSGENYVIAAYYNSKDYAITAAIQSSYYIQQTAVTVSASNTISAPDANIIWQLTKETGSNVSLYNSNQSKYLYVYNSSSYYNLGLNASKKQFTMTEEREEGYASTFAFNSTDYTSYYINYDASHSDFGTSTSSDENLYLYKRQYTGTYESNPCIALGSISGAVSWTNPTQAVLTWNDVAHVSSWAAKWKTGSGSYATTNVSAITTNGAGKKTCTISSLSCNTNYDFIIIATPASGYCDAEQELTNKNSGKWSITKTGNGTVTGGTFTTKISSEAVTEACNGSTISIAATQGAGYQFNSWTITNDDNSGADVTSTLLGANSTKASTSFTMPSYRVTVTANFSCVSTTVSVAPTTASGNYGWRYSTGETIDLTCSTTGATPTGYQWQKYISSDWEDIDGATTARFQKSSCTSSDGGSYRCVVTTGTGCSFQSDGYFIRIFTLDGNYSGEDWTKNAITWTGENTGTVTLSLDESSIYMFKVTDNNGKWFGNGTDNYIVQPVNWNCGTGNSNMRLFTGPEGDYTFTLNISHADDNSPYVNVQVAYPSVTHPVEGYAYVTKWWDCYVHWWYSDGSDHPLTTWGYDPQITTNTTICGTDYWYFPVLNTYNKLIVKNNAGDATSGNTSGDQTTDSHSGMYLTHDGSWGWHDFTTYSITFAGNSNTGGSMTNVNGICPGSNSALAENGYTKTGYHFDGWKTNVAITINTGGDDTNIAANGIVADEATIKSIGSNITLTAQWAANTNTPYTVKHYKQKLDGTYNSSPDDTDNLTGTTAASVTPARKSYTGFTAPSGQTETIAADGSLVIEYKYTRNSYTLAWALDGGSISVAGTTAGSVKFEASLTAPTVTKTGYTFSSWSPSVPATMPAANSTYTATWTANTNTAYTVKHYKMKLDGTYPSTPDDTDNLTGTTAASVTPDRKSYTGFTAPSGTTTTILADGSRVVEYKYTRNNYNVAVASVGNVTLTATPSGGSAIAESANADVYFGQSVTLAKSSISDGYYWGGWKVTKQSDGTDVTASVVSSNTLTVPAYAVNVSAIIFGDAIAWCDPDVTVTGDVHLTSYNGISVNTTSGASNLISISSDDMGSAQTMEIGYLDGNDDEVDKDDSPYRFCNNGTTNYNEADGSAIDLDDEWSTTHSIKYTPNAYDQHDNYKLQLTFKHGDKVLKTVTHAIYGRALPQEFVIATKLDNQWYALPNTLAATQDAATDIVPQKITVDDPVAPEAVSYAPNTLVYKGAARYRPARNVNAIRFTKDGSQWLTTGSGSKLNLGIAATPTEGVEDKQSWYLKSSDCNAYELKIGDNKLGIYNGKMGMFASPTGTSGTIYLLPITNKFTPIAASAHEWGEHGVIVTPETPADLSSVKSATMHVDGASPTSATTTAVNADMGTAKNVKVDGGALTVGAIANDGKQLYIHWKDNGGTEIGVSQIEIPCVIAANGAMKTLIGSQDTWATKEVHVLPGKTLTANAGSFGSSTVTIKELHIYPGATLDVTTGTLTATTMRLHNGWTRAGAKEYNVARVHIADDAALKKTTASIDYDIYEKSDGQHYYPFAVPFATAVSAIDYADGTLASASIYGKHYGIDYYDGATRASGGNSSGNWKQVASDATLQPCKGYTIVALPVKGEAIIRVPLTYNDGWTADGELATYSDVTKNVIAVTGATGDAASSNQRNKGWYMLGVPFMSCYGAGEDMYSADGSAVLIDGKIVVTPGEADPYSYDDESVPYVSVPTHDFSEYIQTDITEADLRPGWSFFVQVAEEGNLTFAVSKQQTNDDPTYYAPQRQAESTPVVRTGIILSDGNKSDKTTMLISDKYSAAAYEINADLEKMFGEGYTLATYSLSGDTRLAYNAMSTTDARGVIPIGFRAPEDGEYTFSLNPRYANAAVERVDLIDYQTGEVTNLMMSDYTFTSARTQDDERFALNVVPMAKVPTGMEDTDVRNQMSDIRKMVIDDHVFIIRNGQMFDVTGKRVTEINK